MSSSRGSLDKTPRAHEGHHGKEYKYLFIIIIKEEAERKTLPSFLLSITPRVRTSIVHIPRNFETLNNTPKI